MSNTGKSGSILKENFGEQKIGGIGFNSIEFYHKASAGDTIIDLSSLVTPTTELAGSGFSQPSPSDLLAANIKTKSTAFKLVNSQGQEMMPRIAYTIVDNSTIRLSNPALAGEIFHGIINNVTKNLIQLPETQTVVATGTLAEGATTFAVGASFRTDVNSLTQLGEVLVYRNGILMFRNVGNAVYSEGVDGNYQEVPIGNGFSNEIEFNIEGDVGGDAIHIVSPTRIIKDDGTLLQQVQTLQGVIDIMRDDLVDEFQVPSSRYAGFSSDVDLRAFNNRMLTMEKVLNITVQTTETQIIRYDGYTSKDGSNFVKFGTRQYNETGAGLDTSLLFSDDNTTQTRITAVKECYFDISSAYHATTTANSINIRRYNSSDVLQEGNNNEQNTGYHTTTISTVFKMNVGDYVVIYANKVPGSPTAENVWFQVLATLTTDAKIIDLI